MYYCERCQKQFDTVFKTVFHLGQPPLEMNLCQKCLADINNYYDTYNIYVRRRVVAILRQSIEKYPFQAGPPQG